ncbi:hypothetical protein Pen01_27250 [Phytomonospora endophytica]|nr:hypothetical protein Pen01_27250 [Phytomonospora endophytica]
MPPYQEKSISAKPWRAKNSACPNCAEVSVPIVGAAHHATLKTRATAEATATGTAGRVGFDIGDMVARGRDRDGARRWDESVVPGQ